MMKPIYDALVIQIEITNACHIGCSNCTRLVGHHKKPYFMDLDFVETAIDSLEGFKGAIGIMGGEPTLHPQFEEICKLLQRKKVTHKAGLWTSGYKWETYKRLIKETFKWGVFYNDHSDPRQRHQPILIAIEEVIDDKELMWELIYNCWVHEFWSPSINPKGAFFCEATAALDLTFNGPGGYPVEPGWWNKTFEEFRDQVERYCPMCGAALPFDCPASKGELDLVSPKNYERLLKVGSPKALAGRVEIFNKKFGREEIMRLKRDWKPWDYLGGGIRKKDLKPDEIFILRVEPYQFMPIVIRHPFQSVAAIYENREKIINFVKNKQKLTNFVKNKVKGIFRLT